MYDIIFIGAGPVGLLAAIQLKLINPKLNILMFEKYEEPIRKHAMYVDHRSFAGMNTSNGFGELLDSIHSKVIISDLEKTLRQYATSIEIPIEYQEIKDFNELKEQYPDTKFFVGSGGLRGIIHPQVFNSEDQINEPLRYAVEVKYKAIGETHALKPVMELPAVLARTKHLVSEYVGRLKDGQTPISLRIFIDESTYEAMKGATFKMPYTLADQDKIPEDLFTTIDVYLKARKHLAAETMDEDSLKISTITLSIYASKYFCKQEDGKIIFQIGEEGFACPFYRSFNDNASCIPYFTQSMGALLTGSNIINRKMSSYSFYNASIAEEDPLEYYQDRMQKFVNNENAKVHLLNSGLGVVKSSVATSQAMPHSSVSKLSFKQGGRDFLRDIDDREPEETKTSSSRCVML